MKPKSPSEDEQIVKILKELASHKASYPPDLLAARRAAFMDQIAQGGQAEVQDGLTLKDQEVIRFLQGIKSFEPEYPSILLAARRTALRKQTAQMKRTRFRDRVRAVFERKVAFPTGAWSASMLNFAVTSLIVVSIAAFAGVLVYGSITQAPGLASAPSEITGLGFLSTTSTPQENVICKSGFVPPLCLARAFDKSQDLTYVGNGSARPAVAKDTSAADGGIHQAAYVNDGLYGPGASWVSESANSWIKIDLGQSTMINTIKFGRDRLGKLNDHDPGQFVIAVALSDNVYANGNSSNDNVEYRQVFDSKKADFNGEISGTDTVIAQFQPQTARYLKITFQKAGTTIDEVEAFMMRAPLPTSPAKAANKGGVVVLKTLTPMPSSTPLPSNTPVPPTDTPVPPTDTPNPPTDTPIPPTDTPVPTDTAIPPSDTPLPPPSDTPVPQPTDTSPPPPDTPIPQDTPIATDAPVSIQGNSMYWNIG